MLTYSFTAALLASIARRIQGSISTDTRQDDVDNNDVSENESDVESVASVVLSCDGSDNSEGEKDAALSTLKRPRSAGIVGKSKAPALDALVNAALPRKRSGNASRVLQMHYRDSMDSVK